MSTWTVRWGERLPTPRQRGPYGPNPERRSTIHPIPSPAHATNALVTSKKRSTITRCPASITAASQSAGRSCDQRPASRSGQTASRPPNGT